MIIIDGQQTAMKPGSFANLEEILVKVMQDEALEQRIITDVLVNNEAFSELYPHQAEDIDAAAIDSVEVRSISVADMAADVTTELYKVITLMTSGGKRVAGLFRQAEVGEALEVLQDVIDVTRNFLATVALLRGEFSVRHDSEVVTLAEKLGVIMDEMTQVMANEDWLLMADLLEYEFLPSCERWNGVLGGLAQDIAAHKAA